MQWMAMMALIGWGILQIFLLFISIQCIFCLIEFRSADEKKFYQKFLSNFILLLFYSLFVLPIISFGLFLYATVNIQSWSELIPASFVFLAWWITLFSFTFFLSIKKKYQI